MVKKKIAIQTLPLTNNYGGILQAYALQTFLESLDLKVIHLNRYNKPNSIYNKAKRIVSKLVYKKYHKIQKKSDSNFKEFISKKINLSPWLSSSKNWEKYIAENGFIAIIVGSDQVWRLEYMRELIPEFFLALPKSLKLKKISYAASFGTDSQNLENNLVILNLLKDFDLLSVREKSGKIFLDRLGLNATQNLDPTLLLNSDDYFKQFNLTKIKPKESYLFSYILDKNDYKKDIIEEISRQFSLPVFQVYGASVNKGNYLDIDIIKKPTITAWLQNIASAEFIVTDSFHGMLFSVIFNKPFVVIANEGRGLSRFESFLQSIELNDRIITSEQKLSASNLKKQIDYQKINKYIAKEKINTISYFSRAFFEHNESQ